MTTKHTFAVFYVDSWLHCIVTCMKTCSSGVRMYTEQIDITSLFFFFSSLDKPNIKLSNFAWKILAALQSALSECCLLRKNPKYLLPPRTWIKRMNMCATVVRGILTTARLVGCQDHYGEWNGWVMPGSASPSPPHAWSSYRAQAPPVLPGSPTPHPH